MPMISLSVQKIKNNIQAFAKDKSAKIIAVSKLQSIEKIKEAFHAGLSEFGENYMQEAKNKQNSLQDLPEIKWHFIGRIQSNKIRDIVGCFDLIHSVDSEKLIQSINLQAQRKGHIQKILLQVNLANESTKGGFNPDALKKIIPSLKDFKNVKICGWMTMPPIDADEVYLRSIFSGLREIRDLYKNKIPTATELSMGTSGDYKIALEEGATLIRLGTAIFGERIQKT